MRKIGEIQEFASEVLQFFSENVNLGAPELSLFLTDSSRLILQKSEELLAV
jgi:hypothetical protein